MKWTPAAIPRPLDDGTVHLWRFRLDLRGDLGMSLQTLSEGEHRRAERYSHEISRRRFVTTRAALREILGAYLQVGPEAVELVSGRYGKTALGPAHAGNHLEFNLTHSGDLALVALARSIPLGVDIERHEPKQDLERLAGSALSDVEFAAWHQLPPAQRPPAFFDAWVRKEAFVKATGCGLGFGLKRFDVTIGPGSARIVSIDGDFAAAAHWTLQAVDAGPGYSAAVAANRAEILLEKFDLRAP